MKKPIGLSIEFGINSEKKPSLLIYPQRWGRLRAKVPEVSSWHKTTELKTAKYLGAKLDLHFGTWKRPVARLYQWRWDKWRPRSNWGNPWNSGDHWFVLGGFPCIGAFVSLFVKIGKKEPGIYLGTKTYKVDHISSQLKDKNDTYITKDGKPVYTWATEKEQGNIYLCPSLSIRADLVD
jgi:hypothetical protein